MTFATELTALNEWHFFREFVYSENTFRPMPSMEVELADSMIWLGDLLIAFQLKERGIVVGANADTEKRWFERKVLKKATRQIRDTVNYLNRNKSIEVRNQCGQTFDLSFAAIHQIYKLVVYLPHNALPTEQRRVKHHRSRTAGFIHIIPAHDYLDIVRTLLTPTEVVEYLSFRESLIDRCGTELYAIPEPALIGQFLSRELEARPSLNYLDYLRKLKDRSEEWDMSAVISKFPDRISSANGPTDYYPIIRELALLKRNELREFKKRFQLCIVKAKTDTFARPYRIAVPRTGCGFVFLPITKDMLPYRQTGLKNFTYAHKYDQRLIKCIGVSIANDSDGWFNAEWCYIENKWVQDLDMDSLLQNNNPFREVNNSELPRYSY
ncbi:hypothetical protein [Desulfobulbus sp.]|uniref:hypothetical protein n=1 Tax=Desulfobulbus sp. TaxID=895 RepID=UPI0027B9304F|nr:hypothetical protein [Desulfobulbus sp.]